MKPEKRAALEQEAVELREECEDLHHQSYRLGYNIARERSGAFRFSYSETTVSFDVPTLTLRGEVRSLRTARDALRSKVERRTAEWERVGGNV